jgi:type-F conjugative transfer system secretin TraK
MTFAMGALFTVSANAQSIYKFKENENIELKVSRDNATRLFVENDKISKVRYPEGYLDVDNDEDGSIYLNVKDDRNFTLFITTAKNRHLSATIRINDSLGETIKLTPVIERKRLANVIKHKQNKAQAYENQITSLVSAAESERSSAGYKAKKENMKSVRIKPYLTSKLVYTLSNPLQMAQKFTLTNFGNTPVLFDEKWFKDKDTKALLVKDKVIYPHASINVVRIEKGARHG